MMQSSIAWAVSDEKLVKSIKFWKKSLCFLAKENKTGLC